jgi:hypothetical protein
MYTLERWWNLGLGELKVGQGSLAERSKTSTTSTSQEKSIDELFDGCWNGWQSSFAKVFTAGLPVGIKNPAPQRLPN